ncbi:hypothetical protein E2C01_052028 [Portunus trituberculatus]|uniref:Uncharacterized protein n=1 Tax=Portunus trituberculatus TaxID=210409 RepID=A0A5B7GKH2_PORTR|nr:hypothetical protein [Portunus trituberculatus]
MEIMAVMTVTKSHRHFTIRQDNEYSDTTTTTTTTVTTALNHAPHKHQGVREPICRSAAGELRREVNRREEARSGEGLRGERHDHLGLLHTSLTRECLGKRGCTGRVFEVPRPDIKQRRRHHSRPPAIM